MVLLLLSCPTDATAIRMMIGTAYVSWLRTLLSAETILGYLKRHGSRA